MEKSKYRCMGCVRYCGEGNYPYCLGKDLHAEADPDGEPCEDAELVAYCCEDCFFYDRGLCRRDTADRYTTPRNEACRDFEYKELNYKS